MSWPKWRERLCVPKSKQRHVWWLQKEPWHWNFLIFENSWVEGWCVFSLQEFSNHKVNHQKRSARLHFRFSVFCTELVCIIHILSVLRALARWTALSSWSLSCESLDWPGVTKGRSVLFAWKVIVSCFQISIISQHLEIRLFPHKIPDLQIFLKMWNSCCVGPAFPHGSGCRNG